LRQQRGAASAIASPSDARPETAAKAGGVEWGLIETPNAPERFAELLAHAAAGAGMRVILPHDARDQVRENGLEWDLQPGPVQIAERAQALGCASYMTAEVDRWRYGYVFFVQSAEIRYRVACHPVGGGPPVWQAQVLRQARSLSDLELARGALADTFEWLRGERGPAAPCAPGEEAQ
jgi:hypothetical protein